MSTAVMRDGADALKVFAHGNATEIARLVDLTDQLRAAGVPVPLSSIERNHTAIRLPWIQGQTMRQQIGRAEPSKDHIHSAMRLLRCLHLSEVRPDRMPGFNPFRLTDKRLNENWFGALTPTLQDRALSLRQSLKETPLSRLGMTIIHGDFHTGQLIQEVPSRKWWMIDLDDVACGHKEADIANFCANLATRQQNPVNAITTQLLALQVECNRAYENEIDSSLFCYYAACALLRRSLKFAERSETDTRVGAVLQAGLALAEH